MSRDNYRQMRDEMRIHFLSYDQNEMLRKFSLRHDENYLYLSFCARAYRVGRRDGVVQYRRDCGTWVDGEYNDSMSIYDLLCCSKKDCFLTGKFTPANSLKGTVHSSSPVGGEGPYHAAAAYFDADPAALEKACLAMGGVKEGRGDVSFTLPLFDFLPVRLSFWCSDDEFPAQLSFFWDSNVLSFMHYETLWFAAGHLLHRLKELSTASA